MSNIALSELLGKLSKDDTRALKVMGEMQLAGTSVEEQLTQENAVSNQLTFTGNLNSVGIYNTDTQNTGVFNINGINIHVPPGDSFEAEIGGSPRKTVSVQGSKTYIVTRYV